MNDDILIDVLKLPDLLKHNYTFIDLRNSNDFNFEHLTKFSNIPYEEFNLNTITLDRSVPIFLLCYVGTKSYDLAIMLRREGYKAYCFNGGYYAVKNPINKSLY